MTIIDPVSYTIVNFYHFFVYFDHTYVDNIEK